MSWWAKTQGQRQKKQQNLVLTSSPNNNLWIWYLEMFKKITRYDEIFKSEELQKDKITFNIMFAIVKNEGKYPTPKIFTYNNDCIVMQSDIKSPIIAWTKEGFDDLKLVQDFIAKEFKEVSPFKILAKKIVYDLYKSESKAQSDNLMNVGAYQCQKLNPINYTGYPDNIGKDEVATVANLINDFQIETGVNKNSKPCDHIPLAEKFITEPSHKVWRNEKGKIVSLAYYSSYNEFGRISSVMTPKEERGKSYAKMVVNYLTEQVLDIGRTPVLFTDLDYASSNKCYTAIGYEFCGQIINFGVDIEKDLSNSLLHSRTKCKSR